MLYQHRVTKRIADLVIECSAFYTDQGITVDSNGIQWSITPKAYRNEGFRRALETSSVEQLVNTFKMTNRSKECRDVISEDLFHAGRFDDREQFLEQTECENDNQLSLAL